MSARIRRETPLAERIRRFVEEDLRPAIREDGGDIAFEALSGREVRLVMGAACATCPARARTVRHWVEPRLRERFTRDLVVKVRYVKPYFVA